MNTPTIILLSGGIDSAAILHMYINNNIIPELVHFSYGQKSEKSELIASQKIANYYNLKITNIELKYPLTYNREEILCRNIIFLMSAAALNSKASNIVLGIHAGTEFYDCSSDFISKSQEILDGYFSGTKQIIAPLISFSKDDIINYCIENEAPLHFTHSCVNSNIPCGKCNSCLQRKCIDENY